VNPSRILDGGFYAFEARAGGCGVCEKFPAHFLRRQHFASAALTPSLYSLALTLSLCSLSLYHIMWSEPS
jgi:hypothetical protein